MKVLKAHKSFGGTVRFWEHDSVSTNTKMKFSTFTPNGEVKGALIWLSGLTCTDENFITKAGAQKYLADARMMIICPDTSPRGLNLPLEHDAYDFGSGAGFYVNATTEGYKDHYKMYDYISKEIYAILEKEFQISEDRISISGHSMGGHGALVIGLREAGKFRSVSAFSPIVNPSKVPWGQKALAGYLGDDQASWLQYDACSLIESGKLHTQAILIDQGKADEFLERQLQPEEFRRVCELRKQELILRSQEGYDHSYYFIATFIKDHIEFHAKHLNK